MLAWISSNIWTIIICALLLAAVGAAIAKLIRDKKNGKSTCGCGCAHCAMAGYCLEKK